MIVDIIIKYEIWETKMSIDTIEKIRDIRKAIYDNKLVVFVGAGVSRNSGLPTWGELITKFAKLLNYDKCDECKVKDSSCPKKSCQHQYNFSQEDDYLEYSQNHILIETFIKSLLIDHVFLFVGYSLNDYNLKLIFSWINCLVRKHYSDKLRSRNYIIQSNDNPTQKSGYEQKNLATNNVIAINADEIPNTILLKSKDLLLPDAGKKVYSCLDYILDKKNDYLVEPLENVLRERYNVFDSFNCISFEDLKTMLDLGHVDLKGRFLRFYRDDEYEKIKNMLSLKNDNSEYVKRIFIKTGIFELGVQTDKKTILVDTIEDELFELYLDNKYLPLINKVDSSTDLFKKAYYYHVCMPSVENCSLIMAEICQCDSLLADPIKLLFYKFNQISLQTHTAGSDSKGHNELDSIIINLPVKYSKACGFFKKLHNKIDDNLMKAYDLLEKHENVYLNSRNSLRFGGDNYVHIWDLQGIAYDYYFYFKFNYLMLDFFSNPKEYMQPYLKAILCTYAPEKDLKSDSMLFSRTDKLDEYPLNSVDLDMFVKFADVKNLRNWIKNYKIKYITIQDDVDVVSKFTNLCKTLTLFPNRYFFNYLESFSIIISKIKLVPEQLEEVIFAFSKLIEKTNDKNKFFIQSLNNAANIIIHEYANLEIQNMNSILRTLTDPEIINELVESGYWQYEQIIKDLSNYSDSIVKDNINR